MVKRLNGVILWLAIVFVVVSVSEGAVVMRGDIAPDFSLTSVNGTKIRLSDYKESKIVVLGLFHICDPCRRQTAELQKIYYKFKDKGIEVIGINSVGNSRKDVYDFLLSIPLEIKFPFLLDTEKETERLYNVRVTPNIYIIDREGIIRFKANSVSASRLETELKKLLK
ncbi:MAG: peroxiredoxin family protein [Nitrospirota bacterium]